MFSRIPYTCYTGYMENVDTQNTRNVAVKVPPDLYALIKKAAHRKEMSLADFVRSTLKEAAEFYVET